MLRATNYLFLLGTLVFLTAFIALKPTVWEIQETYTITFSGSKVSGEFKKFKGVVEFDDNQLEHSKFDLSIDVASISTGKDLMNEHAVGEDWFYAEKYPEIRFESSKFFKVPDGFQVLGKLTMRGISKDIKIPFRFENGKFSSKFEINRGDYNVGGTSGMKGWVAPTLQIEVSVPVRQKVQ